MFTFSPLLGRGPKPVVAPEEPVEPTAIPMEWDDERFASNTAGTRSSTASGTMANKTWDDSPAFDTPLNQFCEPPFFWVGEGTDTLNITQSRLLWREGFRIATGTDVQSTINIDECYIETIGRDLTSFGAEKPDHADAIQAYSPGGSATVNISNSYLRSYSDAEAAAAYPSVGNVIGSGGIMWADDFQGNLNLTNVIIHGGKGMEIYADTGTTTIRFNDVFFVAGPGGWSTKFIIEVPEGAPGTLVIAEWNNVRDATIVDGELILGDLIPAPSAPVAAPPVVSDNTFNIPTSGAGWTAGMLVGTMIATNSPTSWSITSGDASDHFDIASNGDITVTAAGITALSDQTNTVVLTVQATNADGSDTGTATINYEPEAEQGEITHGRQITASNTGHTAYFDAGLGRNVQDSDLTVQVNTVSASDFVSDGGTISKMFFQNGCIIDRVNVTFLACKFVGSIDNHVQGVYRQFTANWCTVLTEGWEANITPSTNAAEAIRSANYLAYRCRLEGCSDGARISNSIVRECWIRTRGWSGPPDPDHNDGVQSFGGTTSTVERCNIDARSVNGVGDVNGALFASDNTSGLMTWHDNWVAGGSYVIRMGYNSTYDVQGNEVFLGTNSINPAMKEAAVDPSSITWGTVRPNIVVDASGNFVSTVAKPTT